MTLRVTGRKTPCLEDVSHRIAAGEHVALVGGDFDVMVLVRARDNRDLRRIVLEEIQSIDGVTSTQTFLIFEDHQPKATS